ncbi:MAG TPA: PHP domain-containing protein [Petrotogaceae bacterium]|jgi:hypothetical protein|nr:PHP domain-containing protein [Petrotogaceae bacterium]HNV06807.1 PHP domain-containing protein [Petrotogaceae bacterium]HOG35684.1 PHP domain-containing protein [Petrotogaceae bacterium]HPA92481.1 PHP domain-containing protein [Petrotogaceae bacterium]HPG48270.1 PHP domain-containing protein [Petrotogaceae bacterium]
MALFNASFHNHSVLSPCADITMTPEVYAQKLTYAGIDWIALTDHNSCRNVRIFERLLSEHGIQVLPGIEVQTKEEIHILFYFSSFKELEEFSMYIEERVIIKDYDPEKLGYQIELNEEGEFNNILSYPYLGSACDLSLEDAVRAARKYDSLCVPAHIFRSFGLITQLGIPPEIEFDGVEVKNPREYETAKKLGFSRFLFGMDAHTPDELEGIACTVETEKRDFEHLKTALYKGKVFPLWQH